MSIIEPGRRHSTALLWAKARPSLHIDFSELVNWSVNYQDGLHLHIFCQMDYSSSSHKGVRSMEVRGAQLLHSLDGTKHLEDFYLEFPSSSRNRFHLQPLPANLIVMDGPREN